MRDLTKIAAEYERLGRFGAMTQAQAKRRRELMRIMRAEVGQKGSDRKILGMAYLKSDAKAKGGSRGIGGPSPVRSQSFNQPAPNRHPRASDPRPVLERTPSASLYR